MHTLNKVTDAANSLFASAEIGFSTFTNVETSNQTSSNYAHGRNMANSGSYRPSAEFLNTSKETGMSENSHQLMERKLKS